MWYSKLYKKCFDDKGIKIIRDIVNENLNILNGGNLEDKFDFWIGNFVDHFQVSFLVQRHTYINENNLLQNIYSHKYI